MGLPFPYPVMGYTYDSNDNILPYTKIWLSSGLKRLEVESDSAGRYVANIQNYAYSGCDMIINAYGLGEKFEGDFKVVIKDIKIYRDTNLTESNAFGNISLNTHRSYGDNLYIFGSNYNKSWMKTVDE